MDKLEEVFAQYDRKRKRVFRGRKMLMWEDEQGYVYGITESSATEYRLLKEYLVKEYLIQQGFSRIDQLVRNKEGFFLTEDRYHTPFLLKSYFQGRECDVNSHEEVGQGASNLALLHRASKNVNQWLYQQEKIYYKQYQQRILRQQEKIIQEDEEEYRRQELLREVKEPVLYECGQKDGGNYLVKLFEKRNRELKRIATYMRKPGRKGAFVTSYNDCSPAFYKEALWATSLARKYQEEEGIKVEWGLCHGSYQHHNILHLGNQWATVGMDNFHFGIQMEDLYDFLRKILEKNEYQFSFAQSVVNGYNKILSLTKMDYCFLYIMLCYPEKFWKISNRYFNTKKTWVPPKTVEKLNNVVKQNRQKQDFLVKFREDYVD